MNDKKANFEIIDLFSGCGGFSLGAHLSGISPLLAVDVDEVLSSSYKLNFPNSTLKNYDLSKVRSATLLADIGRSGIDGIAGGPPCQGFSHMGRRSEEDNRNSLVHHFFRHIKNIQPKFFVMENVPGLLSSSKMGEIAKELDSLSEVYHVIGPLTLDASKAGAATKRNRVVIIGYDPREFYSISPSDFESPESIKLNTVKDAIWELPEPLSNGDNCYGWSKLNMRKKSSPYAQAARMIPSKGLGWDIALENLNQGIVSGLFPTKHTKEVIDRFKSVANGEYDGVSKAMRLAWNGLCPTLRAGTGSDRGSYQSVRPIHPESNRVITVREAARLQGFPDWFVFHKTKWHSFRMIGNSVSPYFSENLFSIIQSKRKGTNSVAA